MAEHPDSQRAYKVLIADPVGLKPDAHGQPDISEVRAHIESRGAVLHSGPVDPAASLPPGKVHFFYQPDLSREEEILAQTDAGQYDALIAAATFIPAGAVFPEGGVRIGAGTGNMGSRSWGGGSGKGGTAPLMNTPSFNSRVTAQRVLEAVLRAAPALPVAELHQRVVAGRFDTGRDLREYPTEKLESRRIAVLGYGNVGREVARLAAVLGMRVVVCSRERHREWILSEGFEYAPTPTEAAAGAEFLSIHTGLGAQEHGRFANQGLVGAVVLDRLRDGAVIINYDRGDVLETVALRKALLARKVRLVAVDVDIFIAADGHASGPLVPYVELSREFPGALELLPHVAADTDHLSRVQGARQAVDQILRAIRHRELVNVKGDVPSGYVSVGSYTVSGIGKVSLARLLTVAEDSVEVERLRVLSESLAAFWKALAAAATSEQRVELIEQQGARLVLESNRYATGIEGLGLKGPVG